MHKNERVTIEYLTEQLSCEKQKLSQTVENLNIHKEILQNVISGGMSSSRPSQSTGEDSLCKEWFYMKNHHNISSWVSQLRSLVAEKDEKIESLLAEILMLKKQMNIQESNNMENEKQLTERAEEIRVKLERTENMFQSKPECKFPYPQNFLLFYQNLQFAEILS